uniref:AB hydrolase-1 domain-containing protein n=1 Tax=Neobodo designis TaxID=312471 RepID=A0A7S1MT61_NEODS|mmetsp:Transcript_464/g.1728  ORF Transcript_464/g.1728 Transcript_464/m.1728 type:complete len:335 (+) Transcript_464:59-1063(+)
MSFLRGFASKLTSAAAGASAGSVTASASLRVTLPPAARMRYTLCRNRWHLDSREPVSVILLHDMLRSSHAVAPITAAITRMPATGHCPTLPLDVYAPDLRYHGRTAVTPAMQPEAPPTSSSMVLEHVSDVVRFASSSVVEFPQAIHLVGVGHGARVALAAAAACPGAFRSVTAIDAAADEAATSALLNALRQLPSDVSKETLATLAAKAKAAIPHEQDRLDVLADFAEPGTANGHTGSWRRASLDAFADTAAAHAWPAKELAAAKFDGPVLSIGKRFDAALPEVLAAHVDPARVTTQQLPADAPADRVLDVFLRVHALHGEVENVVNVACGDGY